MILFIKILIIFHMAASSSCLSLDKFLQPHPLDTITQRVTDLFYSCVLQKNADFVTLLIDSDERINFPKELFQIFSILQTKSFLSNDNLTIIPSNLVDTPYKSEIVLPIVSSISTLQQFVTKLKESTLWNIFAQYFIIDAETSEKKCQRAYNFLRTMWSYNLIKSNFVCINSNKEILIYTFNPYTNLAPKGWQEVSMESNKESSQGTWTLYKRKLIKGQVTCLDVDFQKDLTIGGHVIKAIAISVPPTLVIYPNKTGWTKYRGLDALVAKVLTTKLNATMQITDNDDNVENNGYSESNHTWSSHNAVRVIGSCQRDILLNARYIFNKPRNTSYTYPHLNAGVSMMSRHSGYETGPSKILHFMNPKLIIGMLSVFLITIPILSILRDQTVASASLEVLRIAIGVSMIRMPTRTPLRFYLITVILMFLITGSTFQGSLSAILTSPVALKNLDNIRDLRKSTHTIYVFHGYKNAILDVDLVPRMKFIDHWDCSKYVTEQKHTVCVAERSRLAKIGFDRKLYVSKHRLTTLYSAFIVRPDWPLIRRCSKLLQYMWQCGLINYWFGRTVWAYKPQWLQKARVIESTDYRPMTVADLDFAFYIFFFGLTVSILVFLIERLTWKKCSKYRKQINLPPLFEYTE